MKTETKVRETSIYQVTMPNEDIRYVRATSRVAAILHVFKPTVSSPLTGSQVADLILRHGADSIEVAK